MQHYTTIEQSKKLVELGLSPDTADMFYSRRPTKKSKYGVFPDFKPEGRLEVFTKVDLPCWSLGALLEVMPEIDNQLPSLRKYKNYYCVVYSDNVTRLGDNQWQNGKTPAEAAYNMVVWLLENGYIDKEE